MLSRNRVDLMGRLGADPKQGLTKGGVAVAHFNVATNSIYKDKDGKRQERVDWIRCAAFGAAAATILKYAKKGMFVAVEGELRPSTYTDAEGVKRYPVVVKVNSINMDLPKKETEDAPDLVEDLPELVNEEIADGNEPQKEEKKSVF